jgi:hypothetical protein
LIRTLPTAVVAATEETAAAAKEVDLVERVPEVGRVATLAVEQSFSTPERWKFRRACFRAAASEGAPRDTGDEADEVVNKVVVDLPTARSAEEAISAVGLRAERSGLVSETSRFLRHA